MFRSVLASFLLLGLAAAQPSCDLCDTKTDANGNFITLCFCSGAFEVAFNQTNSTCDDQIAIYKCEDLESGLRQYPLTWLPACNNYTACAAIPPAVPAGQIPNFPACIPVNGTPPTVVFDPMPDYGYYGPNLPPNATFPECECLQVVYQRGGLASSSPPPFLIIENGTKFEIPGDECPAPTPSPVQESGPTPCTPENECYIACDVDEYDTIYEDDIPCSRPSKIFLEYTGEACSSGDCKAPHPLQGEGSIPGNAMVEQASDKCGCTGAVSSGTVTVTVVDKNDDPVPSAGSNTITGLSDGDCFSIGSDTEMVNCGDIDSTSGPTRRLGMDETDNTPDFLRRGRRLKNSGGSCVYSFESETRMDIGGQSIFFHTSCSQPLAAGMKLGAATIIGMIYEETV